MDSVTIREAVEQDYDYVVSLLQQLNPDDPVLTRSAGQTIFKSLLTNNCLILFLAEVGNQPVSTCYLNIIPNLSRAGRSYALIENVVTDRAHRRKGIGAELVKHVIDYAFKQGCYKVMLLTGRDESVHGFYERCGMEKGSKMAFIKRQ